MLVTGAALYPALEAATAWKTDGFPMQGGGPFVYLMDYYTGYNLTRKEMDWNAAMRNIGLVVGGTVAHKIANKVGINSKIRRLTGGWLVL